MNSLKFGGVYTPNFINTKGEKLSKEQEKDALRYINSYYARGIELKNGQALVITRPQSGEGEDDLQQYYAGKSDALQTSGFSDLPPGLWRSGLKGKMLYAVYQPVVLFNNIVMGAKKKLDAGMNKLEETFQSKATPLTITVSEQPDGLFKFEGIPGFKN